MSWATSLYSLLDKSLQFFIKQEDDDVAIPPLSLPEEYTVSLVLMSLIPCRSLTFTSGWSELLGQRSSIRGRLCRAETSRSNQCRRSASPRTSLRPTRVLLLTHRSLKNGVPTTEVRVQLCDSPQATPRAFYPRWDEITIAKGGFGKPKEYFEDTKFFFDLALSVSSSTSSISFLS